MDSTAAADLHLHNVVYVLSEVDILLCQYCTVILLYIVHKAFLHLIT